MTQRRRLYRAALSAVLSAVPSSLAFLPVTRGREAPRTGSPFDTVRVEHGSRGVTCYVGARWIAVEREVPDAVGADILVRPRTTESCSPASRPGDVVVPNDWAEYFMGFKDDVLFLDSGTGPDLRDLFLIDLHTGRKLAGHSYVEIVPGRDSASVGVWDGFCLEAPAPGCPAPAGGLEPGIDSLFTLDARTGETRFAGKVRCASRQ